SRRRHTRSYGDWSSDVCSSDLLVVFTTHDKNLRFRAGRETLSSNIVIRIESVPVQPFVDTRGRNSQPDSARSVCHLFRVRHEKRSEERRVGKECRLWGWPGV